MSRCYRQGLLTIILSILIIGLILEVSIIKTQNPLPHSPSEDTLINKALSLYYEGILDESISLYERAIAINDNNLEIIKDLIAIYKQTGDYYNASRYYEVLIDASPTNPRLHIELGWVHLHNNTPTEALRAFNKALSLDKHNAHIYHGIGLAYFAMGKYSKAIFNYEEALKYKPTSALIHFDLAKTFTHINEFEKAISHYLSALRQDSSIIEIHRKLGELYLLTGQYEAALNRFERATRVNPNDNEAANHIKSILSKFPHLEPEPTPVRHLDPANIDFRTVVPSTSQGPLLRILLAERAQDINIMAGSEFNIYEKNSGNLLTSIKDKELLSIIHKNNKIAIYNAQGQQVLQTESAVLLTLKKSTKTFILFNLEFGTGYFWSGREDRQYRGSLEIRPSNTGFNILNIVPLEEYLYSVVPGEMPALWPLEAVKAQAVAARTYTVNRTIKNINRDYDLKASVLYAAYPGVTWEHPRSTQAVNETQNIILTHNGTPINAVYSSNTGGHTESSKDVWGFNSLYLTPISETSSDNPSFPLSPSGLETWLKTTPQTFSNTPSYTPANSYRWTRVIDRVELENRINHNHNVGTIIDISPLERGFAGSVYSVKIIGTNRSVIITGDSIRTTLGGLRSNRFIIEKQFGVEGYPERFYFYGSGWGHNVGMSQTGAAGMAELGYTYEDILNHYYPGSTQSHYKQ